ncbi:hypothetical protein [Microbacterium plantarum]|uniref:hypothetical protein n=1 Tax=Microbacterium plantarum TaxID=1816425 RepID=UPI002B49C4DB|nr:hypothetical protein [Microbacterium plantarum]WRK17115.1 hypothetical protein VC184_14575 [Microbacterium plantarum]
MDAGVTLGESEWFRKRFGQVAPAVAEGLIRAGRAAHETSAETKTASGLSTDEPYGATFWQVLALTVVEQLAAIQGTRTVRPKGSRFEIPVISGTTVYAAKCASRSGRSAGRLLLSWSHFRDELLREVERLPDEVLPLAEWQDEEDAELTPPTSESEAVVLVTYVASDRGGLERIFIGDGYLDSDGAVIWVHHEELPVKVQLDLAHMMPRAAVTRFDEAPMDDLDMSARDDALEGTP